MNEELKAKFEEWALARGLADAPNLDLTKFFAKKADGQYVEERNNTDWAAFQGGWAAGVKSVTESKAAPIKPPGANAESNMASGMVGAAAHAHAGSKAGK
jgi:hypothetical protein